MRSCVCGKKLSGRRKFCSGCLTKRRATQNASYKKRDYSKGDEYYYKKIRERSGAEETPEQMTYKLARDPFLLSRLLGV